MGKYSYIEWHYMATLVKLKSDEFEAKFKEISSKGTVAATKTKVVDWYLKDEVKYSLEKTKKYYRLYVCDENNDLYIYTTNWFDTTKDGSSGTDAIQSFMREFAKQTEGKDNRKCFAKYFGTTEEEFKNCVPKQLYYISSSYTDKEYNERVIDHVSSIDDSSHYPSCGCGILPDSHTAVRYEGTVEPTEEYPFAFYIKSGHSAEYGVYDTHDWVRSFYYPWLMKIDDKRKIIYPRADIGKEDDITVLMKPAKVTLDNVWKHFYELRHEDEVAKLVMNATIGNFHRNNYKAYKYAHIASVIIARANDKQLRMMDYIGHKNVLHACVDGIIYKGNFEIGIKDKIMGEYHQEFTDCKFKMRGMNSYIAFSQNGELEKFKHGAYNYIKDTDKEISNNPPESFKDMYDWIKRDKLGEVIMEEENNGKKE